MDPHNGGHMGCPSEDSWTIIDNDGYSETREPQYKQRNLSSQQTASVASGSSPSSVSDQVVVVTAALAVADLEENYDPFKHYPGSLESGNTDLTLCVGDNGETLQPRADQDTPPPAPVQVLDNHLDPYLRQLPQHTFKDIAGWVAGAGALFLPFPPPQYSMMVETSSASGNSSASHSRAGLFLNSPDIDILAIGTWSNIHPDVYGSKKLRIKERK